MTRFKVVVASSLLACISAAGIVCAQEIGTGSGTGTGETIDSIQQRAAELEWQSRIRQSESFREDLTNLNKIRDAYRKDFEENAQERAEQRRECRRQMRLASSYTKFDTALDCYRIEMNLNLAKLQKQRSYVEVVPGVTDDIRWLTITRIDLLIDALEVIINAIDSDVYQSIEEIQEVKGNLLENYRKPKWLMMTRLRADKLLTWTKNLMTRIELMEKQVVLEEGVTEKLVEALTCLQEEEDILESSISSQALGKAISDLYDARVKMRSCIIILRDTYLLQIGDVQNDEMPMMTPEEEPEEPISRRLLRRLGEEYRIK